MIVKRRHTAFPSIFDDFLGGKLSADHSFYRNQGIPAVNIKELENGFELELAAPGISKEEIQLEVNERVLTISSKHKGEKEAQENNYTRQEFSYSAFSRSFTLPKEVDIDNISGQYINGVLKVNIPKQELVNNGVKQISIS